MTETRERDAQSRTFGSGADQITYDVRGDLADATADRPALLLIGSPMDARGFGTLCGYFTDRPVVTYDPRGAGRNPTGTGDITPEQHAEDLHALIEEIGAPVDLFASSGGAVNALALVAAHPGDVRRVVAHEPPTAALLPDRDVVLAVCRDIRETYERAGSGQAMAKFIAVVMAQGELDAGYLEQPAPEPSAFGMSADDDGGRTDPLMRQMPAINEYAPDVAALQALGSRLVLGVGAESGEAIAARGARSVADAVGIPVTEFPGEHNGFLGGEYGQQGEPEAFAAALRQVYEAG